MALLASAPTYGWRTLSDAELAATPDARLGAPTILFNITMVVGFWGYMQQGRRPNLFYRRRVHM